MLCRCLDRVVRGAASRDLLVVGSSSGSSILGTEKDALNNGVAQKEEAVEVDVSGNARLEEGT